MPPRFLCAAVVAIFIAPSFAADAPRPKLGVVVVVDQMRADYLERDPTFSGGFKRLAQEGAVFTEARHLHIPTETGPGHAAISTGRAPATHGIVANDWYVRETWSDTYCVADDPYGMGPGHLDGPTLSDALKASDPAARVFSISGKDRAAILLGGRRPDLALWLDKSKGIFTTSSYYRRPAWLDAFNEDLKKSALLPLKDGKVPIDVLASPVVDEATARLVAEVMKEENVGRGPATDLLLVSFSATDIVGHRYGTEAPQMVAQLRALDSILGRMLTLWETASGGALDLAFSADHGAIPSPEDPSGKLLGVRRFDWNAQGAAMEAALQKRWPAGERWILGNSTPLVYLNRLLAQRLGLDFTVSIGEIPAEWLEKYRYLFSMAEESGEGLRLASAQVTLLDQLLMEGDRIQADDEFKRRRENLRRFSQIEPRALPDGLKANLHPYQKSGFDWLHFLHEYGFGGCLADDMGLGKTVQCLAFLQSLAESHEAKAATLLVLPRSLVFNWEREAARFTPTLRLMNHAGTTRAKDLADFDEYDLVLTTYGIMLRDIEMLRKHRFHYVILDEAQAIKNPVSQSAKAARLLQADHKLTLTGTPVENSTLELWSQFSFLNPGLLGNLEHFRTEFAGAIEKRQDEVAAAFLRRLVHPFILRRTKDQVARDLPPRTERILYTEMEPGQKKLYEKTRDYYRAQIMGIVDKEGVGDARMKILEGLLRLRQISNHPRLVEPDSKATSGKFETLLETLDTLRAEGHKALVFSQFVQMLSLVRESLDAAHVPYAYLDGKTTDRQGRVDAFQNNPDLPLFLISLKAGGVGLNLTAADYVIHIDPWWNPAVEMQATDRTHRIGQDKPVFVYKLITRDTVEEKILLLQDRKRALVSQLISTEGGFFKNLTRQDIELLFE